MEPRYTKTDAKKIARPYAKAAFDIAARKGTAQDWEEKLGLLSEALTKKEADALLHNPRLAPDDVKKALAPALDKLGMDAEQRAFVNLLIDNQRLSLLSHVFNEFASRRKRAANVQDVTIISAFPLTPAQVEKIETSLKNKYGITPSTTVEIDPALIGGVRIVMGDTVIDRSIKGDLERMGKHLKDGPR